MERRVPTGRTVGSWSRREGHGAFLFGSSVLGPPELEKGNDGVSVAHLAIIGFTDCSKPQKKL